MLSGTVPVTEGLARGVSDRLTGSGDYRVALGSRQRCPRGTDQANHCKNDDDDVKRGREQPRFHRDRQP